MGNMPWKHTHTQTHTPKIESIVSQIRGSTNYPIPPHSAAPPQICCLRYGNNIIWQYGDKGNNMIWQWSSNLGNQNPPKKSHKATNMTLWTPKASL